MLCWLYCCSPPAASPKTAPARCSVFHIFLGEVYVVPRPVENLPAKIHLAIKEAKRLNWRLHDITITVVNRLDD